MQSAGEMAVGSPRLRLRADERDVLHGAFKYVLHQLTGQCEMQRALGSERWHSHRMTRAVSKSLLLSKVLSNVRHIVFVEAQDEFDVQCLATMIVDGKNLERSPPTGGGGAGLDDPLPRLSLCLGQIRSSSAQLQVLDRLRTRPVDSSDGATSAKLERLWKALRPSEPRTQAAQWQDIGFQGKDPATDFRGMGSLALEAMLRFVEGSADAARMMEGTYDELPFAITMINVVALTFRLFETRHLDSTLYAPTTASGTALDAVEVFTQQFGIFLRRFFSQHWRMSVERNIMSFNVVLKQCETKLRRQLAAA